MTSPEESRPGEARDSGTRRTPHLPSWLWLWLPLGTLAAQVVLRVVDEDLFETWMHTELGFVQNITVAFLLVALASAIWLYRMRALVSWRWLGTFAWIMAAVVAADLPQSGSGGAS